MWIDYTYDLYRVPPMAKLERATLPPETVQNLIDAAEEIQDKFDADPELEDLYHGGFSTLLNEIASNTKISTE